MPILYLLYTLFYALIYASIYRLNGDKRFAKPGDFTASLAIFFTFMHGCQQPTKSYSRFGLLS
jgi:hypothetical protein